MRERPGGRARAVGRRGGVACGQGLRHDARADEPVGQRRVRPAGGRVHHSAHADDAAQSPLLRRAARAGRQGRRVRRRAPRPQRRPQAQHVGAALGPPPHPVARPQDPARARAATRHHPGVPGPRHRCPALQLDLGQGRSEGLQLGRGRLDPRRQRPHEQRRPSARLPALQDLPDLRQGVVKAFVTGGTGFVGAHLVSALLARGNQVTCLVRSPAKAATLGWTGVRMVRGDLNDPDALRNGCAGMDVIFHLAGRISARGLLEFMTVNRDGTANVLEAAAADPSSLGRLLYVSSLAAGGPTVPGRPIDETRPPAPVTDYGRSKLAGEVLVRAAPFPWTIVRAPVVYGEWDREILKLFKVARTGLAPVFGDGSQELSVVYAGDLAQALITAATSPAAAGKVYYAAHPATTTSRGLALAVGRAVGGGAGGGRAAPLRPLP